ncbi:MAG: sulfurtransferase-like selenium metabolism protein YedF [Candidatus Magnetomorum sp.]|nr:sulfurtransferase-like selenium metabolism protein YedF [Candidatus Magnetomorum sp.]
MIEIDARGLNCPAPVLHTKAAVDKGNVQSIKIIVDNEAANQNVNRFLHSQAFQTTQERTNDEWIIMGYRQNGALQMEYSPESHTTVDHQKIMVMCATDRIGLGDEELGVKLMISFIKTLREMGPDLWRLVFVNNGVRLTIHGSQVLEDLREYEKNGLHILVCGTCLMHYNILDQKEVGETTNMLDIVTAMQLADKVINIT